MLRLLCTMLASHLEDDRVRSDAAGSPLLEEIDRLTGVMEEDRGRGIKGVRAWVQFMTTYVRGEEFQLGMDDQEVLEMLARVGGDDIDCGGGGIIVGRDFVVRVVKCFLDAVDERWKIKHPLSGDTGLPEFVHKTREGHGVGHPLPRHRGLGM